MCNILFYFSKDLASAVKNKMSFDFKYLLLVSKTHHSKNKKTKKTEVEYVNPEEEIFFEVIENRY